MEIPGGKFLFRNRVILGQGIRSMPKVTPRHIHDWIDTDSHRELVLRNLVADGFDYSESSKLLEEMIASHQVVVHPNGERLTSSELKPRTACALLESQGIAAPQWLLERVHFNRGRR